MNYQGYTVKLSLPQVSSAERKVVVGAGWSTEETSFPPPPPPPPPPPFPPNDFLRLVDFTAGGTDVTELRWGGSQQECIQAGKQS